MGGSTHESWHTANATGRPAITSIIRNAPRRCRIIFSIPSHRTGVMTAVYRMTADGWTADKAFPEMKQYKFGIDFLHPEFKRFVYAFEGQQRRAAAAVRVAG